MPMIVLISISCLLFIYGIFPYLWFFFNRPFVLVPLEDFTAKITVEQQANRYSYTETYVVNVKYKYYIDGESYFSNRVAFSDGLVFQDRKKAEKMVSLLNDEVSCFVSNKNHSRAFLWKKFSVGPSSSRYATIGASLLLATIAMGLNSIS